jgi:hypothetical protein
VRDAIVLGESLDGMARMRRRVGYGMCDGIAGIVVADQTARRRGG